MKKRLSNIIKALALVILVSTFLVSLLICLLVWFNPQKGIDFLSNIIPVPTNAPYKITGIAVIGDSQSDEYRADDSRGGIFAETTLNWVELLEKHRNFNFGKWGSYGEPRRTGYEYNWARTGANAYSMILSGQHIGVANQVKEKKVNVVVIFIGANDFSPFLDKNGYRQIYDNTMSDADITSKINNIFADITTAVEVIHKAGEVRIILVKVPDWGKHLGVQVAFPFPDQRERVSNAVLNLNKKIEILAKTEGVYVIDSDKVYQNFKDQDFKIGDKKMDLLLLNNDPKNVFLDDGLHAGTVLNGLIANEIIGFINEKYKSNIQLFSNTEILTNAGLNQ